MALSIMERNYQSLKRLEPGYRRIRLHLVTISSVMGLRRIISVARKLWRRWGRDEQEKHVGEMDQAAHTRRTVGFGPGWC